jgi:hypothetical protein
LKIFEIQLVHENREVGDGNHINNKNIKDILKVDACA